MTLKEISKMVGVSVSTVSRVINDKNSKVASKEVQDKIWQIVRETNYVPNSMARNLKLGNNNESQVTSKTIGCIFARSSDVINDPFFSQIARSIEKEAFKQGYIMKYSFSAYDINDPNTFQIILNNKVNGIAVLGRFDKSLLSFINKQYKNVVYCGLNSIHLDYDQVICDGYKAAIAAVKYLAELGHEEIGYVGERDEELRCNGYLDAMEELKLVVKKDNIVITPLSLEGGYLGVKEFLSQNTKVTALFCANDLTAIGAIKAIKEFGLNVPQDISVIGIDDIDSAQYVSPMLTTIRVPMESIGNFTAKVLIDRIENGKDLPMRIEFPFSIIKRESCISRNKRK